MKKNKKAVALEYGDNPAPLITAKGSDNIAEQILQVAEEYGIYIHEDKALAQFLNTMNVGDEIPTELYVVIAEIIAYVYTLEGRFPKNWSGPTE